jgi:hypothetical protein
VKSHNEYNGKKQTVLTRCKVLKVAEWKCMLVINATTITATNGGMR